MAYPINSEPFLRTQRLEIGLLLPSDEPEIIDFIKYPEVWKMRGEHYSPLVNIHTVYQHNNHELPWHRHYFVVRMCQSKEPIGFIGFYQISQPSFITPIISQTPYESVMLSYGLSKHYWGKGLMFESLSACLPWFIASQNVRELVAFAEINNQSSRRILQKLGLQECGLLENSMISADLKDMYKFTIYKS
jgi:RimJ/RimL family protein N-acetyltransferase